MGRTRKILRWLGFFGIGLCLLWGLTLTAFYWLVQRDPAELTETWLGEFSRSSGFKVNFESITVTLLPLPSLALSEASLEGRGVKITAPWISARPSFRALISGEFFPGAIDVLRPRVRVRVPCSFLDKAALAAWFDKDFGFLKNDGEKDEPPLLDFGCALKIIEGRLFITDSDNLALGARGLRGDLRVAGSGATRGEIDIAAFYTGRRKGRFLKLDHLVCNLNLDPARLIDGENFLKINGWASAKDVLARSKFALAYEGSNDIRVADFSFDGALDLEGNELPLAVSGKLVSLGENREINLRACEFSLDRDKGRLDARLTLPGENSSFAVDGKLAARRLSLTQWFGFARNLAPGLQASLDEIVNASMDFRLTPVGLTVGRIYAECLGVQFRGSGSVADFNKPVVSLSLKCQKINLSDALPEAAGIEPKPPLYPYQPLTPMPGEPLAEGETGVDYDIRILADAAVYGDLNFQKASLRVYPGKMDVTRLEDVLLDTRAQFYGGSLTGNCILGADPSLPINIVVQGENIDGKKLASSLKAFPFSSGKFETYVNVFSEGKLLDLFLRNLRGVVSVKSKNSLLKGLDEAVSTGHARVDIKNASLDGQAALFNGKWTAKLATAAWTLAATANGKLRFDKSGPTFGNLPASIEVRLLKPLAVLPAKTDVALSGTASLRKDILELAGGKLKFFGVDAKTSFRADFAKPAWSGSVSFAAPSVSEVLRRAGVRADIPKNWDRANIAASFAGAPDYLKLSQIKAAFGATSVNGTLTYRKKQRPRLEFDLGAGTINLASGGDSDWNFPFMREFDCEGRLKIKSLKAMDLQIADLDLPINLEKGKLNISPLDAKFYGARVQGAAALDFARGLAFETNLNINNIDLPALLRDCKVDADVRGRATVYAKLNAALAGRDKVLPKLDGKWSLTASNGSWRSLKNGKPNGDPTEFKKLSASGSIEDGVLRSSDFRLEDPALTATGKGWLDLNNEKLDCDFEIDMRGLPRFPLRLYGSLRDSKTSIGAGRMALNAIGGAGRGVANLVGGMFSGIGKLFK